MDGVTTATGGTNVTDAEVDRFRDESGRLADDAYRGPVERDESSLVTVGRPRDKTSGGEVTTGIWADVAVAFDASAPESWLGRAGEMPGAEKVRFSGRRCGLGWPCIMLPPVLIAGAVIVVEVYGMTGAVDMGTR